MPVCVSFLPWPEQVVAFSSENNVMECGEITCDRSGLARLLDFLSHSFEGGTDVTGALALYPIPYTLVYTLLPSPSTRRAQRHDNLSTPLPTAPNPQPYICNPKP